MPLHSHCPYVVVCFLPTAVNNGLFCATAEAGWSRWIQGQSPTWRAALVLSNYLGEKPLLCFQPGQRRSGKSDNSLAQHNAAALIVRTPRWQAREICRRFSLSSKQCSGKAADLKNTRCKGILEAVGVPVPKLYLWNVKQSYISLSYQISYRSFHVSASPKVPSQQNESSFQSLHLIKRAIPPTSLNPPPQKTYTHTHKIWQARRKGFFFCQERVCEWHHCHNQTAWPETDNNRMYSSGVLGWCVKLIRKRFKALLY